jgi:uncharacterized protein (DUF2252 family)
MAENAFSFFHGSCHHFYENLQRSNALTLYPETWVCGDMHMENFGTYKGDNGAAPPLPLTPVRQRRTIKNI